MELKETRERNYTVIFEPAEEGGYTAVVPALPGCVSEGNSLEETATEYQRGHGRLFGDVGCTRRDYPRRHNG